MTAGLVLVRGLTRGGNRVERLTLSPSTHIARLEIQLEPRDSYPRFRAELRSVTGQEITTQTGLVAHLANGSKTVSLDVPATALSHGEYELALKAGDPVHEIGYYYFSVEKE